MNREVIPPAGTEYDPRMGVPHIIAGVDHDAHPGRACADTRDDVDELADAFTFLHVRLSGWCSESHLGHAREWYRRREAERTGLQP